MATTFPIRTSDGVSIVGTSDGYLQARNGTVGFTRLPPVALAAAVLAVPTTKFDDLFGLIKRYQKAAKRLGERATVGGIHNEANGGGKGYSGREVVRQPSTLEQHVKAGCRAIRCRVCG